MNVSNQSYLQKEYFDYDNVPPSWIDSWLKKSEVIHAAALANNLDLRSADRIEADIDKFVHSDTQNRFLGLVGKIVVAGFYRFSQEQIFSSKRGYIDFTINGKSIVVKTSIRLENEVLLLPQRVIESDRGADIFIGVNIDYDDNDIWGTVAYITGWITKLEFREKCYYPKDMRPGSLFIPVSALSDPKSLPGHLKEKTESVVEGFK